MADIQTGMEGLPLIVERMKHNVDAAGRALGETNVRALMEAMRGLLIDIDAVRTIVATRGATSGGPDDGREPGLEIDAAHRVATFQGVKLALTRAEFDLLLLLVSRAASVVRYDELAQRAPGERDGNLQLRVRQRIHHLIRKLGPGGYLIKNVRGIGYKLTA